MSSTAEDIMVNDIGVANRMAAESWMKNGLGIFNSFSELLGLVTPHHVDLTLLVVCEAGSISGIIDLAPREMHAGSIMVLRRGHVVHDIRETSDFKGFIILAEDDKLDGLLPMMTYMAPCLAYFKDNPIVPVSESELENIRLLHNLLMRKNAETEDVPYARMTVNAVCEALFYETLGIYTTIMERRKRVPTRREELLSKFIALIEQDYRTDRAVGHYARKLCLSPKHLSAVVKSVSGIPAGEWIDRKVVLEAKLMLRNTGMTIQEVSAALNFSNQSFFGKYFKHHTGMSPREFRSSSDI